MIDSKNCAKDEVKDTNRQNSLPKTDEMEAEVLFYCSYGNNCAKSAAKVMHNFRTIVRLFDKKFVSMIFF